MDKVRPAGMKVLVKMKKACDKVKGILLPSESQPKRNEATIIAIGPEVIDFRCGDVVMFNHYAAIKLREDDPDHYILEDKEIYCTLG